MLVTKTERIVEIGNWGDDSSDSDDRNSWWVVVVVRGRGSSRD